MTDQVLLQAAEAYRKRSYDDVIKLLEPALNSPNPPAAVLSCMGFAFFQTKQFSKSVSCWEALLKQKWPSQVEIKLRMNRARASYMAAQAESREGRYENAARLLGIYCEMYPGDPRGKSLSAKLQRLASLKEGISGMEAARRCIAASRWSEAADQLLAVRKRVGQISNPSSVPDA